MSRTLVIVGASAGVGRATARRFAAEGNSIGLIARDPERLRHARHEVEQAGGRALVCPADASDAAALDEAAGAVERAFGPVDIWINCAMVTVFGRFADLTPEEFRRVTEVTYLGYVYGTMAALRRMRPRNRGTIIQVGSALAYRSIPLQSAYCGAKHGIVGFTDSLRSELIHEGSSIRLTVVHLPAVNTPQFDWARNKLRERPQPLPPIFQPEVAADAIHFAAEHPRREFWLGWPTVKAIVGQRLWPGLMDVVLARMAYSGQKSGEPALDRPDNLMRTVPRNVGAHGRFDDRASPTSSELWLIKHGRGLACTIAVAALAGTFGWAMIGRQRR
jgi:NAD(P)-dependent dehydrogenase (short-subunit alcohol dehydrogenase family)